MKKLRILQFITPAGFYGAERWVLALANNLARDKVECHLAVTKESENQDLSVAEYYPVEAGQVHYLTMRGRFDVSAISKLVAVIKKQHIDIIHTHGYKSDILGLIAARLTGIGCVSTPHGFSGNVGMKLGTFIKLGALALRFFDAVAPLSEELVVDMKRLKVPPIKTHFIRNGVDLREIDSALESIKQNDARQLSGGHNPIIGFIGQMIPRKGVPHLLEVFDQLYQKNNRLRLQLIGDGYQLHELKTMAAEKKSNHAIEFLGFRSDRLALLSRFDLFVMTSSLEGIPRCMMEAMAVGVPIVAYDIPGVDQLIEDGVTGLLAPYGDQQALEKCCQRVLYDSTLAEQLTTAARRKIDEKFSAARMAKEYEMLFSNLVERRLVMADSKRAS